MSDELDRIEQEDRRRVGRQRMSAMEQMMRIYGADFIRAFKALEDAHTLVDAGSVALAGTHARFAALMLSESGQVNDRGRSPQSIVAEIATVFDPKPRMNFQELWVFDEHCINEICNRLGCNRGTALGLLKEWREGGGHKQINAPQVEEEEEIVDGEVVAELEPGDE